MNSLVKELDHVENEAMCRKFVAICQGEDSVGIDRVAGLLDNIDALAAKLAAALHWEDAKDEWSERISAAHPMHTGAHEAYGTAMRMVGNRHSKGQLVALVTWLLQEQAKLAAGRALVGEMAAQMRWALDAIRYPLPEEDPGHFCGSHGGCDSTCSDRAYHEADVRKAGALLARADEFCKGGG